MSLHFSNSGVETVAASSRPKGLIQGPKLGEGSYSNVYFYKDSSNNEFARKIFKEKEAWEHEKALYCAIRKRSEFITPFLGADLETIGNKTYYFIDFEVANEGTLFKRISSHGQATLYGEESVMRWLCDILLGLEYLHHHLHVAHNDLKSENILLGMVNGQMRARITDLGAAENPDKLRITDPFNLGPVTPGYGPPELYMEKRLLYSSDTWSLGSIAFELVTGRNAFLGGTCSCANEDDRNRKIIANVLAMDPRKLKMDTSRFPISRRLRDFIIRVLFEPDCELRLRASALLSCSFLRNYLEVQHVERLSDQEFRTALEKIKTQNEELTWARNELKKKHNDLLMTATALKKRTFDYNEVAKELSDVKKKVENMVKRPGVDSAAQVKRQCYQSESEDELETDYKESLTQIIKEVAAKPPAVYPVQWVIDNKEQLAQKYPSMRIKHIARLYSMVDFLYWIEDNGAPVLETVEFLLTKHFNEFANHKTIGRYTGAPREVAIAMSTIITKRDGETFTTFEEAVIALLYIILRDVEYIYRHLFAFTRRTEKDYEYIVRTKIAASVKSTEGVLIMALGEEMLAQIDNEARQ